MNPILYQIISIFTQDTRTCPKCGNRQKVARVNADQPVRCNNCGADIPPHCDSDRGKSPPKSR